MRHSTLNRLSTTVVLSAAAVLTTGAVVAHADDLPAPVLRQHPTGPVVSEDDPRWDCRTMGDHACGVPITANGVTTWYVITFVSDGTVEDVMTREDYVASITGLRP